MKEWRKISRAADGKIVVTITLSDDNLSAKWSRRTVRGEIKEAIAEARKGAAELLEELRDVA